MVIKFICQLFYPSLLSLSPARVYEDRGDFFFSFHFLVFSFRRQRRHHCRATVLSEWLNVECVGLRASLEWLIIWSMLIVVIADDTHNTAAIIRILKLIHTFRRCRRRFCSSPRRCRRWSISSDSFNVHVVKMENCELARSRWSRERVKEKWEEWEKLG